jgi:hypothetical protein
MLNFFIDRRLYVVVGYVSRQNRFYAFHSVNSEPLYDLT